jgi:HSP20 family protein
MSHPTHPVTAPVEVGDFADEIRRAFAELGATYGLDSLAGECSPSIDVLETETTLEVVVDVPGVSPDALRLVATGDALLVVGEKASRGTRDDRASLATFHLVERGFGRFARAVRLASSCDPGRARATLSNGELRISVPKITERRGRSIPIPIHPGAPA